jgi:hypothetical protein
METKSRKLLENLRGVQVYCTTRGTVGDADGLVTIDDDIVASFEDATISSLSQLKLASPDAYQDCMDYWQKHTDFAGFTEEDFYVLVRGNDCLLVWEQD